jgi:hypothetical protein
MVLAVAETVFAQYVFETISIHVSHKVDQAARIGFPILYVLTLIVLCLPFAFESLQGENTSLVLGLTCIGLFVLIYGGYCVWEAVYWHHLYLKRNVSTKLSSAQSHKDHCLSKSELHAIYDWLYQSKNNKPACTGAVHCDILAAWAIQSQPALGEHETALKKLLAQRMGYPEFTYPVFEEEFGGLVKCMALILTGQMQYDPINDRFNEVVGERLSQVCTTETKGRNILNQATKAAAKEQLEEQLEDSENN